jgi:hypothetical protein
MKKIFLAAFALCSIVANAGNLNVTDSKNLPLIANAKISQVYQTQKPINSKIEVAIISVENKGSCAVLVDTQIEANSLIAAINTGATINCSDSEQSKRGSSDYITKSYNLSTFFGN